MSSRKNYRTRRPIPMIDCPFTVSRRGTVQFGKPCSFRVPATRERAMERHQAEDHREQLAEMLAVASRKLAGRANGRRDEGEGGSNGSAHMALNAATRNYVVSRKLQITS